MELTHTALMNPTSDTFLQELTESINKLKKLTKASSIEDLSQIANEIIGETSIAESPSGIPPPDDLDYSYTSYSSSISMPDIPLVDKVGLIKTKNKELRKTAASRLKDFKKTSKNLFSKSQLQSNKASLILSELEIVKKNLDEACEESKNFLNKNNSLGTTNLSAIENDENMAVVYQKIRDIQREINEAATRLTESEKMIFSTEEKNLVLENRIRKLEDSINSVLITEGPDKSKSEHCMCILS